MAFLGWNADNWCEATVGDDEFLREVQEEITERWVWNIVECDRFGPSKTHSMFVSFVIPKTGVLPVEYKFIQNHFHPKRVNFHPKPLSSQYHFHPKTTFIPNQFHPKPLSSQNNFIQNQFHPKNDFEERTTANKSKNNIVRVCVKASPAEGRRCFT